VKVLFGRRSIGKRFDDLAHRHTGLGAAEKLCVVISLTITTRITLAVGG
jgi:hypothetical protein